MRKPIRLILIISLALGLVACTDSDPGPLTGTWKMDGMIPMTVQFRKGESEAMGMIEKVSYEVRGKEVIVTSESGPMEGIATRYLIVAPNTVTWQFGTLTRIR